MTSSSTPAGFRFEFLEGAHIAEEGHAVHQTAIRAVVSWREGVDGVLKRSGPTVLLAVSLFALLGVACSSTISEGSATLPVGIESARLPTNELAGYMYFGANPPVGVATERFATSSETAVLADGPDSLRLSKATIAMGASIGEFGGTLEFASQDEAQFAWNLYQSKVQEDFWVKLDSARVHVVRGQSPWASAVREQIESGGLVGLKEHDPEIWTLITNLPESTDRPPLAVGVLTLDGDLIKDLASAEGIRLFGLDNVFGFVKVDSLVFGVYADSPSTVPEALDNEFLTEADVGLFFVSNSGYPGFVVSFLLGTVGGRVGLETIDLGDSKAHYRTLDDLHLVVNNRGSLVFAALAGTRTEAERLMLKIVEQDD